VVVVGFLIIGAVAGFGWGMDRQLRGGLLEQREEAAQRPDWVEVETLQPYVARAFLAVVDPGFEEGAPVRQREEGQTIPRQLVRQIHLLGSGIGGEAKELVMAPVLEQRLNRRDMLELYLNRVYLGESNGYPIYGVHYAATEFFGKGARELTLGEAATLAGLLLDPMIERPADTPGAVGVRRNEVLRAMLRDELITPQQYQQAISEALAFQPGLADPPMTRRLLSAQDTAVIRLPPQYRSEIPTEGSEEENPG
jgi:membrane peptidoglycan carboxypeptidase